LNVVLPVGVRSDANEYVLHGMLRFIRRGYAPAVRHGGMLLLDRRAVRYRAYKQRNVIERAFNCLLDWRAVAARI
jgi:hypothetical protein